MPKLGGFKLTKLISNVKDSSETLELSVPVPLIKKIQHPTITSLVLGLKWDQKADILNVNLYRRCVLLKDIWEILQHWDDSLPESTRRIDYRCCFET